MDWKGNIKLRCPSLDLECHCRLARACQTHVFNALSNMRSLGHIRSTAHFRWPTLGKCESQCDSSYIDICFLSFSLSHSLSPLLYVHIHKTIYIHSTLDLGNNCAKCMHGNPMHATFVVRTSKTQQRIETHTSMRYGLICTDKLSRIAVW